MQSGKKKNHKEQDTLRKRGTKRYRERVTEEKESKQEIKDYEDRINERRAG